MARFRMCCLYGPGLGRRRAKPSHVVPGMKSVLPQVIFQGMYRSAQMGSEIAVAQVPASHQGSAGGVIPGFGVGGRGVIQQSGNRLPIRLIQGRATLARMQAEASGPFSLAAAPTVPGARQSAAHACPTTFIKVLLCILVDSFHSMLRFIRLVKDFISRPSVDGSAS